MSSINNIEHINFKKVSKSVKKTAEKSVKKVDEGVKTGIKEADKGIKMVGDATLGGLMQAINEIIKIVNKIDGFFDKFSGIMEKFFNNLIKWFSQWDQIVKFIANPTKAIAIVLTICVPIVGQLIARFMLYNGSMDHVWLMLFAIPPLSIVPALAMIFGFITPLKGGSPWDNVVWVPLVSTLIGSLVSQNNKMFNIIKVVLGVGAFCVAFYYKSQNQCPKQGGAPLSKIALDSLVGYLTMLVLTVALPFTPYVGKFFEAITMLVPYGDLCLQAFAVFIVYVGTNIVNGSLSNILCTQEIPERDLLSLLLVAICLTFIVSFAPGSMVSMMNNMASKL